MSIQQNKKFSRLLLAASISVASLTLVACGDDNSSSVKSSQTDATDNQSNFYLAKYNGDITPITTVTWDSTEPGEESIRKLTVNGDNLIAINRWFNGVVTVPTNAENVATVPVGFAALTTSHEHKNSSDEDYVSGASEHELLQSWISDDESAMYALVEKPEQTVEVDDTYGLFKVPLNADGSVPSETINNQTVYHRINGVVRVGSGMTDNDFTISKALPTSDGRVLAFVENFGTVATYSSDLIVDEASSFEVNGTIENWASSKDAVYIIVKDSNNKLALEKHSLDNLATIEKSIPLEASGYLLANNDSDSVILTGGYGVTIYNSSLTIADDIGLPNKVMDASLSTDGERLAVTTENEGEVVLIDLGEKSSAITTVNLGNEIIHFAMGDKQTLFANFERTGDVQKFVLNANPIALTADELLITALENVTAEAVNHGYHGSAVRYNLSLPTNESGGLPNVSYQWTSNSSAVDITNGKVQRPAKGSAPISVSINLIVTAKTDGESKTDSKTIELQILPQEETLSYDSDYDLPEQFKDYQYRVIDINEDGSKLAMFARKAGKLLIMEHNVNNGTGGFSVPDSYVNLPEPYNGKVDAPVVLWKDSNTILVVANKGSNGVGAVLSYDVAGNSWTTLATVDAPISGAEFTSNQQNLTMMLEKTDSNGDDSYQMMVKKVSDMSDINSYDFPIEADRYVVSNDGNIVYTVEKNKETSSYELVRFNQGVKDFTYPMPSKIYDFQVHGDKLVYGDYHGDIYTIENAMTSTPPLASQMQVTYTARNDFDGTSYSDDDHKGRNYITANTDSKIFTMYREVGMSIYSKTANGYIEDSFITDKGMYRVFISGDEKKMFTYDRSNSRVHFLGL